MFQHGVVALLGFGWRYVADGLQEPSVVEPVDPFEGGELDGLEVPPWSAPVDQLGLVKTVDGFGEGIVIGISDAADRRLYACFSQALGVFDRDVLAAPVAVVHEPAAMDGLSVMQGLLQCVEHEAGVCRARHPPAHDPAGIGVDHKGDIDKAGPGRDIGEVGEPEDIRPWRLEVAVDVIQRAWRGLVADRGFDGFAADYPLASPCPASAAIPCNGQHRSLRA